MGSRTGPRAPRYVPVAHVEEIAHVEREPDVSRDVDPGAGRREDARRDTDAACYVRHHAAHGVHAGPQDSGPDVEKRVAHEVVRRSTRQWRMGASSGFGRACGIVLGREPRVRRAHLHRARSSARVDLEPRDARLPDVGRFRAPVGAGRHEGDEVLGPGREADDLRGNMHAVEAAGRTHAGVDRPRRLGAQARVADERTAVPVQLDEARRARGRTGMCGERERLALGLHPHVPRGAYFPRVRAVARSIRPAVDATRRSERERIRRAPPGIDPGSRRCARGARRNRRALGRTGRKTLSTAVDTHLEARRAHRTAAPPDGAPGPDDGLIGERRSERRRCLRIVQAESVAASPTARAPSTGSQRAGQLRRGKLAVGVEARDGCWAEDRPGQLLAPVLESVVTVSAPGAPSAHRTGTDHDASPSTAACPAFVIVV